MPSPDARRRLAEVQVLLLRALAGRAEPPEDFDSERVRAAAEALADGRSFAADLARRGELPDPGRLEALAVDLHYRRTRDGLKPRRGPAIKTAWLRGSRRLILAVRLPWLGARRVSLPWW